MAKKKNTNRNAGSATPRSVTPVERAKADEQSAPPRRKGILPALSIGDLLALLAVAVLSAALLLEGYHKDFKDYSAEIVALFAVVIGFLLGRKT